MGIKLSYDDVLIKPQFSTVRSRSDVSLEVDFLGMKLGTPIISSNMDTVSSPLMSKGMQEKGAINCLHRFMSIEDNVQQYFDSIDLINNNRNKSKYAAKPIVSVGVGDKEFERAIALVDAGATHVLIDVAHGAALHVVEQYDRLRSRFTDDVYIIVGNFATRESIVQFNENVKSLRKPDAFKLGIGGGSLCVTRTVTGAGIPTLESLLDCSDLGVPLIADGGIRNSGDIAKALTAGASVVMIGKLFAGTDESPSKTIGLSINNKPILGISLKEYRGSASSESYEVQGKAGRTPEGESTMVPYTGPVSDTLDNLNGGLRSALTYVGASDIVTFKEKAELVEITHGGMIEGTPHGKT